MNNQNPFYLYKYNKHEFLRKPCALCLSPLFYPASGDAFVSCCRLKCNHMFHNNCINQSINANHLSCPECRDPIGDINNIKNIDKSVRIAIYNEAYDNGFVEPSIQQIFERSCITNECYPFYKPVFELWQNSN